MTLIRATMPPLRPNGIEIVYQIKHEPGHKPQTVETVIAHCGSIGNAAIIVQALREHMGTPNAALSNEYPLVTFYWRKPDAGRETTPAPTAPPAHKYHQERDTGDYRPRWGRNRPRHG